VGRTGHFEGSGSGPLQVDGRRHDLAPPGAGAAGTSSTADSGASASAWRRPRRSACSSTVAAKDGRRPVPLGRCGRELGRGITDDDRVAEARRRLRRSQGPSAQSRHRVHRQRGGVEVHGRWERRFAALRGAPGGDELPSHLDRPGESRRDAPRRRPGRDRHRQRRRDVELLVQPAHRADVSTSPRTNAFPLPPLRGPAGKAAPRVCRAAARTARISFREWHPAGSSRSTAYGRGPDPLDPDVVYGGKVSRYDPAHGARRTTSSPVASPRPDYRTVRTQPLVFAPKDPAAPLYFASNTLWKTRDGGPEVDAHQPRPDAPRRGRWPPNVGKLSRLPRRRSPCRRGVIYAVAPSPVDGGGHPGWGPTTDWCTSPATAGSRGANVTPPDLHPWAKVVHPRGGPVRRADRVRGDQHAAPRTTCGRNVYRTHDGGGSPGQRIVSGLPDGGNRETSSGRIRARKGLLYCGTEQAVYVLLRRRGPGGSRCGSTCRPPPSAI